MVNDRKHDGRSGQDGAPGGLRVLALTRYDASGASSRVRFLQYFPYLQARGFRLEFSPLLSRGLVAHLYATGRRALWSTAKCYLSRLGAVRRAQGFDLVWLEKELWPWAPGLFDPGLLGGLPYVVDYDDAVFHNYDEHPNAALRRMFARKIDGVMRQAAVVVAGNEYLAARARAAGARRVEIVPSVVDGEVFRPHAGPKAPGFSVGWIGSPVTQRLLGELIPVLRRVIDPVTDRFVTIGAQYPEPLFPGHVAMPWSEQAEAATLAGLDVGVMPLRDEPFERGKCGFKLVQYMACGLPVVASPVGVNSTIVRPGVNGYLARNADEWERALLALKADHGLRDRMGRAGRQDFEAQYSLAVNAPRVAEALVSAAQVRNPAAHATSVN